MYNLPSVLDAAKAIRPPAPKPALGSAQYFRSGPATEGIEATIRCLFAYPADAAIVVLLENEQRSCRLPHDGPMDRDPFGGRTMGTVLLFIVPQEPRRQCGSEKVKTSLPAESGDVLDAIGPCNSSVRHASSGRC